MKVKKLIVSVAVVATSHTGLPAVGQADNDPGRREYCTEGASTGANGVVNPEAYVRAHILALIDYLARIPAAR